MLNEVDVLILQVYTLKSDHDEAICDEIGEILHQEGRSKFNVIIMGVVGEECELVDFCKQHDLVIINTWNKKTKESDRPGKVLEI